CMIVRNEEANLPACLGSVADLVDEMVLVDTGSTDRTRDVAASLGARVVDFPWVDDFAAARNESLRHATGDWAFWLDADDRLDEGNRRKLRALFTRLKPEMVGYSMKCRCLPEPGAQAATVVDHVRLFPRHPDIRWQYRVHEQILPALRRLGGQVRAADVVIEHAGYSNPQLRQRKTQRDLRLLRLDHQEYPDDPFILFNLGWVTAETGQPAEALPLLRRSLALSHPTDSIVRKLYPLIMECHRRLGQPAAALAACQEGRRHYPEDAQLLFQEALLRQQQGDRAGAITCLRRLLQTAEGPHFASVAEGLRGFQARHQLALLLQENGQSREAEALWQAALVENADFTPGWLGLAELYLRQGRWTEAEQVAEHLAGGQATPVPDSNLLTVLRARVHLGRKEFASARELLESGVQKFPEDVRLWIVLSHVLLQEGQNPEAAAEVLRTILRLDPTNGEARHNLALLARTSPEKVPG
ncbi:MAG: tetratricopeptide repeat protein, partial [Planctomycetes bacterium]|nr:tetratricopeptide repeat protein [Planctomycetota bacterium]